jgi:hypothetical protein
MSKEYIRLNTRLDLWKDTFNDLTNDVGDIALLSTGDTLGGDSDLVTAINELDSDIGARPHTALTTAAKDLTAAINEHDAELGTITSVAMGTTASTVSTAIAEVDERLDSINNTLISSPELYISNASADNEIKGNLDIGGDVQIDGTLTVDGVVSFKAGSAGSVVLGDDNTDNVTFSADVNSNIVPNTNNTYDLGSASQQWKDLFVDGVAHVDGVDADSAGVTGVLTVGGAAALSDTLTVADATSLSDTLTVTGATTLNDTLTVANGTTLNGNVDIGDATTDTVSVTARIDTDLVPSTDGVRDLGATGLEWRDLHIDGTANIDTLEGGAGNFSGDLDVDGATTLDDTTVDGTLNVTGVVTADAGIEIDNITINESEIDVSSGALTLDVATEINLDAGNGSVHLKNAGTKYADLDVDGTELNIVSANGNFIKFTAAGIETNGTIKFDDDTVLDTTSKNVAGAINELRTQIGLLEDDDSASTSALFASIGEITSLDTANKTNTVAAINELHAQIDSADAGFFSRARSTVSATTSGTGYGGLSYNSSTGVITFAKVTSADIRERLSGGTAITYTNSTGVIAVTSNSIGSTELNVSGTGNAGQALISDGDGSMSWGRSVPNIYDSDGTLLN